MISLPKGKSDLMKIAFDRLWIRQADILVQLLERWFDGRELFNQVDFSHGY